MNVVVEGLYKKYPDVRSLAEADVNDIEEIVRPCGLGKSKARDISACMKILWEKYGGKVPEDFDALLALPGVGRKSANLIMGDVFHKPAIVTDTHCTVSYTHLAPFSIFTPRKRMEFSTSPSMIQPSAAMMLLTFAPAM